ncbi:MAG: hypothetical protein VX902_04905 [Planctomycetota bacterium]|nr:hypothetical protein [Planctomycetota bacterium]
MLRSSDHPLFDQVGDHPFGVTQVIEYGGYDKLFGRHVEALAHILDAS